MEVSTGSDLTECEREKAPAPPREGPDEAIVQRVDDKGPGEGNYRPDGKHADHKDEIEGKIASRWGVQLFSKVGDEFLFLAGHGASLCPGRRGRQRSYPSW